MKLKPRQKKELLGLSILIVLIVLSVIYQGHLKTKYLESLEVTIIQWSPDQKIGDLHQEIANLEKNPAAEECFREGNKLLKQARVLLDRNLFLKARKALECANNTFSTYSTTFNLGICLFYLDDFPSAGNLFLKATEIRPNSCGAENFLGLCMFNTGRWKEGMNHLFSALQKAQNQKKQLWEAVILSNIGVIYKHMGNYADAEKYHDFSLVLCQRIGYKRGEAGELINLAHLTALGGEIDRALRIFDNALASYKKINDERGEASTFNYIARLYQQQQDNLNALKYYQKALSVSQRIGYHLGVADNQMELGIITYWQKKSEQALLHYIQAEKSYHLAGFPDGTSDLLSNLGLLYKDEKEYQKALEYYKKALVLDRSTLNTGGEAHDSSQIGAIYELKGLNSKAIDAYRQARDIFQSLQLNDRVKDMDNRIQKLTTPASPL